MNTSFLFINYKHNDKIIIIILIFVNFIFINMKTAILTCENIPNLLEYDQQVMNRLNSRGFNALPVIWDHVQNIDDFDFYLFRTTWGYHFKEKEFRKFIRNLKLNRKRVLNPANIIENNIHKFYLRDLMTRGIDIIPTYFLEKNSKQDLNKISEKLGTKELILKPAVSAASHNTYKISAVSADTQLLLDDLSGRHDLLVQAFEPEIMKSGEFSTIYFHNGFHYTVNKIPASGDYRIQRDYGGKYELADPPPEVLTKSGEIAGKFINNCLYARIDGVLSSGKFKLMEVEMIEPDLYMDLIPEAVEQYVKSVELMI